MPLNQPTIAETLLQAGYRWRLLKKILFIILGHTLWASGTWDIAIGITHPREEVSLQNSFI